MGVEACVHEHFLCNKLSQNHNSKCVLAVGESVWCGRGSRSLDSPHKIYVRTHAQIKPARRKVAGKQQFIKDGTLLRWESAQARSWQTHGAGVFAKVMGQG